MIVAEPQIETALDSAGSWEVVDRPGLLVGVRVFHPAETFPAHHHTFFDEVFIGVRGVLTVRLGDEAHLLSPSEVLVAPRGTVHSVSNDTASDASVIVVKAPNVPGDSHRAVTPEHVR